MGDEQMVDFRLFNFSSIIMQVILTLLTIAHTIMGWSAH